MAEFNLKQWSNEQPKKPRLHSGQSFLETFNEIDKYLTEVDKWLAKLAETEIPRKGGHGNG